MKMSRKHTLEFFDILDADKSGGLSINEFKDFLFSEDCRESKTSNLMNLFNRIQKTNAQSS